MRVSQEILLTLITLTILLATCKRTERTKLHKILTNSVHGHRKDSSRLRGFKKDTVQRDNGMSYNHNGMSYNQVADAFNTNKLDSVDKHDLSQLQDFNKQYINSEEASETALLADHGIDDNSALKISNMASLPSEFAPGTKNMAASNMAASNMATANMATANMATANMATANMAAASITASKTEIGTETAKQPPPVQGNGDDDAALWKDANSWPEYRFKDSDYSNYHIQEEVNGPMDDNSAYGPPNNMYWQDEYGEPPHTKPRPSEPGKSDEQVVTSQDNAATDASPIMSGIPLNANSSSAQSADQTNGNTSAAVNTSSTNATSTNATASLAKQTATSSQTSPDPSSDSTANPSQPKADTSTAVSQNRSNESSTTSSTTDGQVAQSSQPQADSSKAIAKVLSGLVAGTEVPSTKEGTNEGQDQSQGQGQVENHPQVNLRAQADGLNNFPVPKDTTSELNHPRSRKTNQ